jgi:hypothetical protein
VTLELAEATEEIPIAKAKNTIDTKMDNMIMAIEAWSVQLSKENEPRLRGYRPARVCTIHADHQRPNTPINFLPPNAPTGPS